MDVNEINSPAGLDDVQDTDDLNFLKCVVVGDGAVGKTCLLMSYATKNFPQDYVPTVFDTYCVSLTVCQSHYQMALFDTAGQEDYRGLRMLSYPSTHVFIVCFSVVQPDSFTNVQQKWVPELRHEMPHTPFILVGTQSDLREDKGTIRKLQKRKARPVSVEQAAKVAKKLHAVKYIECSSLTGHGLENVFHEAVMAVVGGEVKKDSKILRLLPCVRRHYNRSPEAISNRRPEHAGV